MPEAVPTGEIIALRKRQGYNRKAITSRGDYRHRQMLDSADYLLEQVRLLTVGGFAAGKQNSISIPITYPTSSARICRRREKVPAGVDPDPRFRKSKGPFRHRTTCTIEVRVCGGGRRAEVRPTAAAAVGESNGHARTSAGAGGDAGRAVQVEMPTERFYVPTTR